MDDGERQYSISVGSDSESNRSPTPDEESIRRLFITCDTDGDGFITSDDILEICGQLSEEFDIVDLMNQLGADENGRISLETFVTRRYELMDDVASQSCSVVTDDEQWPEFTRDPCPQIECKLPTIVSGSENNDTEDGRRWDKLGSDSGTQSLEISTKQSSCDLDSGAHDLDIEQIRKLNSNGDISTNSTSENHDQSINDQDVIDPPKQIKLKSMNLLLKERDSLEEQINQINATKREHSNIIKKSERHRSEECKIYETQINELNSTISVMSEKLNTIGGHNKREDITFDSIEQMNIENAKSIGSIKLKNTDKKFKSTLKQSNVMNFLNNDFSNSTAYENKEIIKSDLMNQTSEIEKSLTVCLDVINSTKDKSQIVSCFRMEHERLKYKILNLQSQCDLLRVNLDDSKCNSENMAVLLGKYESNNSGLQLAITYYDHISEAWQVLNRLLQSEMGLLLASCRAAGIGKTLELSDCDDQEAVLSILTLAQERRTAAEGIAIEYMRKINDPEMEVSISFTRKDEQRIREYLEKCISDMVIIRNALKPVDILEEDSYIDVSVRRRSSTLQKQDLENVVLMQELMALKEDKSELKSQLFIIEREVNALKLDANRYQMVEQLQVREIERLKKEKMIRNRIDSKDVTENNETEIDSQIDELFDSLCKISKNYERQMVEYNEGLAALRKQNGDLRFKIDRLKRRGMKQQKKVNAILKIETNDNLKGLQSKEPRRKSEGYSLKQARETPI